MSRVGSHYSQVFNTDHMVELAAEKAQILQTVYAEKNIVPILVYSGFSGATFAMAISIAMQKLKVPFHQMYIRKKAEDSHGRDIEQSHMNYKDSQHYLVFVDDFISLGHTVKYVVTQAMTCFDSSVVIRPYVLVLTQYVLPAGFFSLSLSDLLDASVYAEYRNKEIIAKQTQNFKTVRSELPRDYAYLDEVDWFDNQRATYVFNLATKKVEIQF